MRGFRRLNTLKESGKECGLQMSVGKKRETGNNVALKVDLGSLDVVEEAAPKMK
jgi:hypothetical protein